MRNRRGASLVEVLIAFAILLITSVAATTAMGSFIRTSQTQKTLTQAMAVAESKLEDLLVLYSSDAQLNGAHGPEYYDDAGAPGDSGSEFQVLWVGQAHDTLTGIVSLTVTVSWLDGTLRRKFVLETLRSGS
jgi:Tfp pilus assembly protein PilV